jgi:hypothetical protein
MPPRQPDLLTYLIPVLVLLPLLYFRMRRSLKPQALKLNRLWIRPAILIVMALLVLLTPLPGMPRLGVADGLWLLLAAMLGALAGWQWGRTTQLHLHPENGTLMQTGSMAGLVVLIALVVVRLGLRTGLSLEARALHINVLLITDASIIFSAMLFAVRGLEIYIRARRIMAQAVPAAFD